VLCAFSLIRVVYPLNLFKQQFVIKKCFWCAIVLYTLSAVWLYWQTIILNTMLSIDISEHHIGQLIVPILLIVKLYWNDM
jgi:hypothetical protein